MEILVVCEECNQPYQVWVTRSVTLPKSFICLSCQQKGVQMRVDRTTKLMNGEKLYELVVQFMKKNKVRDVETIYQSDRVIESAYVLLEKLYNIVAEDPEIKALAQEDEEQ